MPKKPEVIKHLTKEELLEEKYKREKNPRIKERLLAILHLYEGKSIPEVSRMIKSESSIKRWLKRWNKKGYDGLIPELRGGPKPKLPDSEWDKILKEIEGKGMTINVKVYVKTTRRVEYSYNGMACIEKEKESQVR